MNPRSLRVGAAASIALAAFYVVVVAGASASWEHLADQTRQDWYYLVPIVGGFGLQVGLMAELRRRHRLQHTAAAASGAGAGASTVGMVACCAHHLADLAPIVGATGAAAYLTDHRIAFMVIGIGVNVAGIAIAAHRLRWATHGVPGSEETGTCVAA